MVAHEDWQKLPRLVNEPRFGRKTNYSHQRIAFRWIDKVVTPAKYKRQRKLGAPLRHDLRHSLQSIQRNRLDLFRTLRPTTNFTRRGSVRFTQRTQMLHQIRNTTRLFPHYGEINRTPTVQSPALSWKITIFVTMKIRCGSAQPNRKQDFRLSLHSPFRNYEAINKNRPMKR